MKSIAQAACAAALLVAVPAFAGSSQGWLYWSEDSNLVKRAHLDGTNVETLYGAVNPLALDLLPEADEVYWVSFPGSIQRGNLDGSAPVELAYSAPDAHITRLVLNPDANKMYWITGFSSNTKIYKANTDGSGYEEITLEGPAPTALAIDVAAGKLYWGLTQGASCSKSAKIQRSNFDGTGVENVVTDLKAITALAVDHAAGKVYWSEQCGVNTIKRANLDGTGIEPLVFGEYGLGIALDPAGGKMYWTRINGGVLAIRWADLDGTDVASLILLPEGGVGIAVLPASGNPADLNDDGLVNGIDLAILLGAWGRCPPKGGCDADLNGDGAVNGFDLALLLGAWST